VSSACYEALLIPLGGGVSLRLEEESPPSNVIVGPMQKLLCPPEGCLGALSRRCMEASLSTDRPPFACDPGASDRGLNALWLFELRDYYWELEFSESEQRPAVSVSASLLASKDADLWKARRTNGRFRFVNYLGSAWIETTVNGFRPVRIAFEVASPKLDYEQQYRSMVEFIGAECQQLLLEWGTPTSLNIVVEPTKEVQTLLEQFLFLRHVVGPGKLDLYLESVSRYAHSLLKLELNWKPAGVTDPSYFAKDPSRRGRDWRRAGRSKLPGQIQSERKFDTVDTPPNRFIKFALNSFRNLCNMVLNAEKKGKRAFASDDAVALEASSMERSLDEFLLLPLFEDVGDLQRLPFESTILQRREGYREILLAWLMLEAAARLDWPGRGDFYNGTTRDVATLYEYWIYFLLVRAFRDRLGMLTDDDPLTKTDGALPFCCRADNGRLVINLRQREASFTRFRWRRHGRELRVHFFYNRSFGRKGVGERGTYSKTMRPDYSLVIIPEEFDMRDWREAERTAEKAGSIAYLHFDAKYRGENLSGILGAAEQEEDEPEDGRTRAVGSAKRVDLYKMHTYNEAIRRTIGSYVIYPGESSEPNGSARYERYHEIIPGIGAFALRPGMSGLEPSGLASLCDFISDVLAHQSDRFTQSYRIASTTEHIIREQPVKYLREDEVTEIVSLPTASVILGYMRQSDVAAFSIRRFFYCRATDENGEPLSLDIAAAQGAIFIGWSGSLLGPFHTVDWMGRIASCRLVTRDVVSMETGMEPASGSFHYLLFKMGDVSAIARRDVTSLVASKNRGEGGKFRIFQTTLVEVFKARLAIPGLFWTRESDDSCA
jgi:predicted component of viral defense system (DUF524 family)